MEVLFDRCACGTVIPRSELTMRHSGPGGVAYSATLCASCTEKYKDAVRIVCIACLKLQGFLEPAVGKDGFEYKRGVHYHINGCPNCKGTLRTPVIEHELWLRARRMAAKVDLDLVQEIEQKALQGEREYRRVRSELDDNS